MRCYKIRWQDSSQEEFNSLNPTRTLKQLLIFRYLKETFRRSFIKLIWTNWLAIRTTLCKLCLKWSIAVTRIVLSSQIDICMPLEEDNMVLTKMGYYRLAKVLILQIINGNLCPRCSILDPELLLLFTANIFIYLEVIQAKIHAQE